ncbi:MAG: acyl-CoA thioesterase [Faecalibacterium sp.]
MFVYRRKAQYHETDQMGIIHHANYIKWMEEARVEFMDRMGLSYKDVEQHGVLSPVAGLSVDYKKPVFFADEVEVRVSVQKYTGVILEMRYEFFDCTRNELCTAATSRHCFMKDGRVVSLKRALPQLDANIRASMEEDGVQ